MHFFHKKKTSDATRSGAPRGGSAARRRDARRRGGTAEGRDARRRGGERDREERRLAAAGQEEREAEAGSRELGRKRWVRVSVYYILYI